MLIRKNQNRILDLTYANCDDVDSEVVQCIRNLFRRMLSEYNKASSSSLEELWFNAISIKSGLNTRGEFITAVTSHPLNILLCYLYFS